MNHPMKAQSFLAALSVCVLVLLAAPAQATFTYHGTVTCIETGEPLEGQCVFFIDERNRLAEVVTNESGEFFLTVDMQGPNSPGWFLSSYAWLSTCNGDGEQLDVETTVIASYPSITPATETPDVGFPVDPNKAVCFYWDKELQKDIRDFEVHFQIPGCEEECDEGCTYTIGYWKTHNKYARQYHKRIPWPIPEWTQLCGHKWYDILKTPPRGKAWTILAHQWIAAKLNVANGACTTPEVDLALEDGERILNKCYCAWHERDLAIWYAEILDSYNNGEIGPGHCDSGDDDDDDDDRYCRRGDDDDDDDDDNHRSNRHHRKDKKHNK
jgi:hypothetical protein